MEFSKNQNSNDKEECAKMQVDPNYMGIYDMVTYIGQQPNSQRESLPENKGNDIGEEAGEMIFDKLIDFFTKDPLLEEAWLSGGEEGLTEYVNNNNTLREIIQCLNFFEDKGYLSGEHLEDKLGNIHPLFADPNNYRNQIKIYKSFNLIKLCIPTTNSWNSGVTKQTPVPSSVPSPSPFGVDSPYTSGDTSPSLSQSSKTFPLYPARNSVTSMQLKNMLSFFLVLAYSHRLRKTINLSVIKDITTSLSAKEKEDIISFITLLAVMDIQTQL